MTSVVARVTYLGSNSGTMKWVEALVMAQELARIMCLSSSHDTMEGVVACVTT